jgi:hypothetical protein
MRDDDLLQATLVTFAAIENSLETVRLLLVRLVEQDGRSDISELAESYALAFAEDDDDDFDPLGCHHADALEITTLGDGPAVFVCPDCGEQFE